MININENIKFDISTDCVTLYYRHPIKVTHKTKEENIGKHKWDIIGYYPSIGHALTRVIDLVGIENCGNLQDISDRIAELKKNIIDMLEKCDLSSSDYDIKGIVTFKGKTLSDLFNRA